MRLGILEIVVIIIVIIVVALITRILRGNRGAATQSKKPSAEVPASRVEERASRKRDLFRRAGIALTLIGIILLIAIIGMFRWAFQSYMWSFVIVAIGLVLLLLSKHK